MEALNPKFRLATRNYAYSDVLSRDCMVLTGVKMTVSSGDKIEACRNPYNKAVRANVLSFPNVEISGGI